jgi:hypothetical protein
VVGAGNSLLGLRCRRKETQDDAHVPPFHVRDSPQFLDFVDTAKLSPYADIREHPLRLPAGNHALNIIINRHVFPELNCAKEQRAGLVDDVLM